MQRHHRATGGTTGIGFNGRWTGTYSSPTRVHRQRRDLRRHHADQHHRSRPHGRRPRPRRDHAAADDHHRRRPRAADDHHPAGDDPAGDHHAAVHDQLPGARGQPVRGRTGYVNPEWKAKADGRARRQPDRQHSRPPSGWTASPRSPAHSHRDGPAGAPGRGAWPRTRPTAPRRSYAQFVIYDLPSRDCSALASNGELRSRTTGSTATRPSTSTRSPRSWPTRSTRPCASSTIIEIDSLPNLVTNLNAGRSAPEAQSTGAYVQGVRYALDKLHAIPNVYNYIDAAHHGWLGWDTNFGPTVEPARPPRRRHHRRHGHRGRLHHQHRQLLGAASSRTSPSTPRSNGTSVRQSKWVDWNYYVDELTFAQAFRNRLDRAGLPVQHRHADRHLPQRLGRRPTRPDRPPSTVDRRRTRSSTRPASTGASTPATGATRPAPASASGPTRRPGRRHRRLRLDQASGRVRRLAAPLIPNDEGKGFDRMCDPTYTGNDAQRQQPDRRAAERADLAGLVLGPVPAADGQRLPGAVTTN